MVSSRMSAPRSSAARRAPSIRSSPERITKATARPAAVQCCSSWRSASTSEAPPPTCSRRGLGASSASTRPASKPPRARCLRRAASCTSSSPIPGRSATAASTVYRSANSPTSAVRSPEACASPTSTASSTSLRDRRGPSSAALAVRRRSSRPSARASCGIRSRMSFSYIGAATGSGRSSSRPSRESPSARRPAGRPGRLQSAG